jgi:hypothetical protein
MCYGSGCESGCRRAETRGLRSMLSGALSSVPPFGAGAVLPGMVPGLMVRESSTIHRRRDALTYSYLSILRGKAVEKRVKGNPFRGLRARRPNARAGFHRVRQQFPGVKGVRVDQIAKQLVACAQRWVPRERCQGCTVDRTAHGIRVVGVLLSGQCYSLPQAGIMSLASLC